MQVTIKLLNAVWTYDPEQPLGSRGGFGQVFLGASEEGNPVAVKKLDPGFDASAHREFLIANDLIGKTYTHIIPILDFGEDEETGGCFIVMERADRSLQDHVESLGTLSSDEVREALLQIASGLHEIENIVHRDLKPRNILFHEDRWKIADFGISRLVDKTTSSNTLKTCR